MRTIRVLISLLFPFILIAFMLLRCGQVSPRSFLNAGTSDNNKRDDCNHDTETSSGTDALPDTEDATCVPKIYTFANNVDGYFGCTDIEILQLHPDTPRFSEEMLVAGQIRDALFPHSSKSQLLIRMRDIFGYAANQVPTNAKITNASLTIFTKDETVGNVSVHQMFTDWNEGTTWNDLGGITPNNLEASAVPDDVRFVLGADQYHTFDVTQSLLAWQDDPTENRGWTILNMSGDDLHILSSETAVTEHRPRLDIEVCGTLPNRSQNLPPEVLTLFNPVNAVPVEANSGVLDVVAIDEDTDPLDITFYGRERGEEFWTMIVIPDTQYYTLDTEWPKGIFPGQTQWIVDNREALNIKIVLSAGDIVENGAIPEQWLRADEALSTLIDAGIPYMPTPGDHDHEGQFEDGALTLFTETFSETRFDDAVWWGDVFDDSNSSHYSLLTIGADDYLFIGLDFCPDANEVAWADDVLALYPERKAILITHSLIDDNGKYYGTLDCGRYNGDTFYIWESLISRHDNLQLALSAHMHQNDGEYRRTDDNLTGTPVHQIIADYQMRSPDRGNGLLRIMTFYPSQDKIRVQTYSPYRDAFETDEDSQFVLPYKMSDDRPFEPIGAVTGVPSGAHATLYWNNLRPNTTYEWYAVASDGKLESKGPVWTFTIPAAP